MPYKDKSVKVAKHKEYSRKYYEDNKERLKEAAKVNRKKGRAEWAEFKATLSCTTCGFNHPAALDFHHVDRTNHRSVNVLAREGSYAAAREEIKKCVVLCANCHRIHHYDELQELKNPAL